MIKVSEETIAEILKRYQAGETPTALAREFKVAKSSVYRWINERTERDVQSVTKLSQREFHNMQEKMKYLQLENDAFHACNCCWTSPLEERYEEITRLKERFSVHSLCRILRVNTSAYYHHLLRSPEKTQIEQGDEQLRPRIKKIFEDSKERFGSPKIKAVLAQNGIHISRERITRLMKEMDLECKQNRLRYWSSTARRHKYYKNKVKRQFIQPEPNLVWVSDITYIRVKDKFCYVCIVIDLFSRMILAHRTAAEITSKIVWDTFEEAFERRKRPTGLTFHSDQGTQYTDYYFRKRLKALGVKQSFSNPGSPLDNAVAESFFACMKREELSHHYYNTMKELDQAVSEYIEFYNTIRVHQRLGNITPLQAEKEFYANHKK